MNASEFSDNGSENIQYLIADRDDILALPDSGDAWNDLVSTAGNTLTADFADQNDYSPSYAVAAGLVYVRTGDKSYKDKVVDALTELKGTEENDGARTLSIGRQLAGWLIAADLVGYRDSSFVQWVDELRTKHIGNHGRWVNLTQTHENSASNWGAFAGSSRVIASLYVGDDDDVERASVILRGAIGDRSAWPANPVGQSEGGFQPTSAFDETWACDYPEWKPINAGCPDEKLSLDGAIVEDISRSDNSWPDEPDRTGFGYSWETLQGLTLQALALSRNGYPDAWEWSDNALLRAVDFLYRAGGFEDDNFHPINHWVVGLIDAVYGSNYTDREVHDRPFGRSFGYTEWLAPVMPKADIQSLHLIHPPNELEDAPLDQEFSWKAVGHASEYEFQLAGDNLFENVLFDSTVTDTILDFPSDLDLSQTWYWRVRALDEFGKPELWSAPAFSFTTPKTLVAPIMLHTPSNNAEDVELQPDFSWEEDEYAAEYTVQLSLYNHFIVNVLDTNVTDSGFRYPDDLDGDQTYYWRVRGIDDAAEEGRWSEMFTFHTTENDVSTSGDDEGKDDVVTEYHLQPNYPNPFNPVTLIQYSVPEQTHVMLNVYNALGQRVKTLVNKVKNIGNYEVQFNASELPSGVYLYRLQTDSFSKSKQMLLIK